MDEEKKPRFCQECGAILNAEGRCPTCNPETYSETPKQEIETSQIQNEVQDAFVQQPQSANQPQLQNETQWQNGAQPQHGTQWQNGAQPQYGTQWQGASQPQSANQAQTQYGNQWQYGVQPQNGMQFQNGTQWQNGMQPQYGTQPPSQSQKRKTTLMLIVFSIVIILLVGALVFVSMRLFAKMSGTDSEDPSDKKNYTQVFDSEDRDAKQETDNAKDDKEKEDNKEKEDDKKKEDNKEKEDDKENVEDNGKEENRNKNEIESSNGFKYTEVITDVTKENFEEDGQDESLPYYSGPYNALKTDLSYTVSFSRVSYTSDDINMLMTVEFPQISSDSMGNTDRINSCLSYEYEYFLDFYKEYVAQYMDEDSIYYFDVDSFVTYMDEDILSVVFYETIYLEADGDSYQDINFYCVNLDLTNNTMLSNTDILDLNENFAIDFRKREIEENGDEALTTYSDQEILEMLQDESSLVIFYTPMGLEVGLNLDQRIVYVTYSDYEKFLNKF